MGRERLLIVVDPIPSKFSVQFGLLVSLSKALSIDYDLTVFSNYISPDRISEFRKIGINVILKESGRVSGYLKKLFFPRLNESLLWGVNWFLDILSFKLGHEAETELPKGFDYVVNLSSTVVCEADVLWIQGAPFVEVVESISDHNILAGLFLKFFRVPLKNGSILSIVKMADRSKSVVANSQFIASRYEKYPFKIDDVIYSSQELSFFKPLKIPKKEKYVLTYLGKETDLEALISLADKGVRIKAFGAKIPPGFHMGKLKGKLAFLGAVSKEELVELYNGAFFVAFPFTNEPFGLIPIEAMLCGKPVLSYNKEGPAETVIDGVTGWLVESRKQFVDVGSKIWSDGETGIDSSKCIRRGSFFTVEASVLNLNKLIKTSGTHEIYSYN